MPASIRTIRMRAACTVADSVADSAIWGHLSACPTVADFGGTGGGPTPRTQPGRDALVSATIDLKTAVFGDTTHVKVNTFGLCQECGGTGCQNGTHAHTMSRLPTVRDMRSAWYAPCSAR